jgi:hypothetical protein
VGAFHGSFHVRSADRDALLRALAAIASSAGVRFLVARAAGPWTPVYPSGAGQDFAVSRQAAAALGCDVVHVLLHDDDVFAFELHRAGVLADRFSSDPDYFGEVAPEERAALAGRPERLADLLKPGATVESVSAAMRRSEPSSVGDVLSRGRFPAGDQLVRFARALGLANVETSYEQLRESRRRGFEHVPRLASEATEKRAAAARTTARRRQLGQAGLLLASEQRRAESLIGPQPVVCAAPGGGFFVAWRDGVPTSAVALLHYRPPWDAPVETGLVMGGGAMVIAPSPSGALLAVGHAFGEWRLEVFSSRERRLVAGVPLPRAAEHVSFLGEDRVLCRSEGALLVVSVPECRVTERRGVGFGKGCATHPDGEHVVVHDAREGGLVLCSLREPAFRRSLSTARHDLAGWMRRARAGERVSGFRPAEVPEVLAFTRDGSFLLMAAVEGVRVYRWPDVLAARGALPPPVAAAESPLVEVSEGSFLRHTYDLDFVETSRGVLFAGLEGRLRTLGLDGTERELLEVPGAPPLLRVVLSADARQVATVSLPGLFDRSRRRPPPRLDVWDWERLAGNAAVPGTSRDKDGEDS